MNRDLYDALTVERYGPAGTVEAERRIDHTGGPDTPENIRRRRLILRQLDAPLVVLRKAA